MSNRSDFEKFTLPESSLSLKLIFDNVRNYLICGAVMSMSFWFKSGKATPPPLIFNGPPKDGWQLLVWSSATVFAFLFLLNAYQSYLIGRRAFKFLDEPQSRPDVGARRLPWYLHVAIYVLALVFTAALLITIFFLALFVIYLSWFAAIGGRS